MVPLVLWLEDKRGCVLIFFTSDHGNIIRFCGRPFRDAYHMNEELIRKWNQVVSEDDEVFVLGDFMFRDRLGVTMDDLLVWGGLNGTVHFIRGNHDKNNDVKAYLEEAVLKFFGKRILLIHNPLLAYDRAKDYDFVFCGHVHEKWKFRGENIINLSVDQWDFFPVHTMQILKAHKRWKRFNYSADYALTPV
jgi:calcineurin-like phosphoesterase family protein